MKVHVPFPGLYVAQYKQKRMSEVHFPGRILVGKVNLRHSGSSVIHIRVGKVKIQHSFLIYYQPSLAYIFGIYSLINFVSASKHAYCKEVRNPVRILLNSLFSSHNSSFWTLQMCRLYPWKARSSFTSTRTALDCLFVCIYEDGPWVHFSLLFSR